MKIQLTKSDREFARRYNLTDREMIEFIEEKIKEEEMMHSFYLLKEKEERERKIKQIVIWFIKVLLIDSLVVPFNLLTMLRLKMLH